MMMPDWHQRAAMKGSQKFARQAKLLNAVGGGRGCGQRTVRRPYLTSEKFNNKCAVQGMQIQSSALWRCRSRCVDLGDWILNGSEQVVKQIVGKFSDRVQSTILAF